MKNNNKKYLAMIVIGTLSMVGALVAYRFHQPAIGGGGMGFGVVMVITAIQRMANPDAAREQAMELEDERGKSIRDRAYYISSLITMVLLTACTLVFAQMGNLTVAVCFAGIMLVQIFSMLLAQAILRKKM